MGTATVDVRPYGASAEERRGVRTSGGFVSGGTSMARMDRRGCRRRGSMGGLRLGGAGCWGGRSRDEGSEEGRRDRRDGSVCNPLWIGSLVRCWWIGGWNGCLGSRRCGKEEKGEKYEDIVFEKCLHRSEPWC